MVNEKGVTLSSLLFDEKRYKLLSFLLNNKDRELNISELAEETGLSRQFVSKFVENFTDLGLLEKKKKGNMYLVSLNKNSAYFNPITKLLEIDSRPLKNIAEKFGAEIKDKYSFIDSAVLFGSVARGNPTSGSDIDILLITSDDIQVLREQGIKSEVEAMAESYGKKYTVNISLTFYERKQFLNDLKASRTFVENVVDEGEILEGEKVWGR